MKILNREISFFVAVFIFISSIYANAQILTKKTIGLELAKKLAAVAEEQAINDNLTVVISIVDNGGNLIFLERMDGTQLGSIEVSIEKAKTELLFKRPTKVFQERIEQGANAMIGLRNALPLEGGLPFIVDGEIVGSIGVSGASSAQDGVIANAAVNFLISLK